MMMMMAVIVVVMEKEEEEEEECRAYRTLPIHSVSRTLEATPKITCFS